jgi:hypothetical protein
MGLLSWLFGSKRDPHSNEDERWDLDWDEDDDWRDSYKLDEPISHGSGKYTSRFGNKYERFRPKSGVENRNSYKIEQSFEVAGAFAHSDEINSFCDWLTSAGEDAEVVIVAEKETTNPHDPNAIKLSLKGDGIAPKPIGYFPKEIAKAYANSLPVVELETIYQRREITVRTLVKRSRSKKSV